MKSIDLMRELTIGDWFLFKDVPMSYNLLFRDFARTTDIATKLATMRELKMIEDMIVENNQIAPIPITEYLLIANGFVLCNEVELPNYTDVEYEIELVDEEYRVKEDDHIHVYYHRYHDRSHQDECKVIVYGSKDHITCEYKGLVRYVHELQGALRICGLKEMANDIKLDVEDEEMD